MDSNYLTFNEDEDKLTICFQLIAFIVLSSSPLSVHFPSDFNDLNNYHEWVFILICSSLKHIILLTPLLSFHPCTNH